jgi:hypothetical protein
MTLNGESKAPQSAKRLGLVMFVAVIVVVSGVVGGWLVWRWGHPPTAAPAPPPPAPKTARVESPRAQPAPPPVEVAAPAASSARRAKPKPAPAAEPAPVVPVTGTVTIESDVANAMVFLDREFKGNAPVTVGDVAPGTHHLNVSAEGYDGYSDSLEVAAGPSTVTIRFKEVKLNEAVPVVHKHAVGSCQGRLVADTQGLRYETPNKNDAFAVKFSDVEVFEVDYLKKVLRVKPRGGRTFNFTNDSADALFVFHKKVQSARERLAK